MNKSGIVGHVILVYVLVCIVMAFCFGWTVRDGQARREALGIPEEGYPAPNEPTNPNSPTNW